jgi:uncharacterized membrane protein YbhN (UPF0104 family)
VSDIQRRASTAARYVGILVALGTLALTFRTLEPARLAGHLEHAAPRALLALLPAGLSLACDTAAFQCVFSVLGYRVRFLPLFRVRVATESLSVALPAGVLVGESIKPFLLRAHCGLPTGTAVAGMVARKVLLLLAQSAQIALGASLAFGFLVVASPSILGAGGLPWLLFGAAAALGAAAFVAGSALHHGKLAARLFGLVRRVPLPRLRTALDRHERGFTGTDTELARFFAAGARASLLPSLGFLGVWLIEALETCVLLWVLGVSFPMTSVLAVEVALLLVRNIVFFVPAGLGLQDLGYVAFLRVLGAPDPVSLGAALSVLKRGKEAIWVAVGFTLLALGRSDEARRRIGPRAARSAPLGMESA